MTALRSWKWDYPVGAGDYYALYPKSWFDYRWEKFPAHVVLEQFSPVLPDNYKETSYPSPSIAGTPKIPPTSASPSPSCSPGKTWSAGFAPLAAIFSGGLNAGNRNHCRPAKITRIPLAR